MLACARNRKSAPIDCEFHGHTIVMPDRLTSVLANRPGDRPAVPDGPPVAHGAPAVAFGCPGTHTADTRQGPFRGGAHDPQESGFFALPPPSKTISRSRPRWVPAGTRI